MKRKWAANLMHVHDSLTGVSRPWRFSSLVRFLWADYPWKKSSQHHRHLSCMNIHTVASTATDSKEIVHWFLVCSQVHFSNCPIVTLQTIFVFSSRRLCNRRSIVEDFNCWHPSHQTLFVWTSVKATTRQTLHVENTSWLSWHALQPSLVRCRTIMCPFGPCSRCAVLYFSTKPGSLETNPALVVEVPNVEYISI